MPDRARLERLLQRLDGAPYPAWRDLLGHWELGDRVLIVDHVQGDPFAAPSRLRARVPVGLDPSLVDDEAGVLACEDWLLRRAAGVLRGTGRGSGRSGALAIAAPGPEVLERSALRWADGVAELRFTAGLPARGRRILGRQGEALLLDDIPRALDALVPDDTLPAHVRSVRRQRALRDALAERGLVAFVEDGAILPRRSGVDGRPLPGAVPFEAPPSLATTLSTPWGDARGMGVPEGVTLIVGGGFHGKSTLLQALEAGWADHVPGDGREGVVARDDTVKIRAEDGRRIARVDISAFLGDLPGGHDTRDLSTEDASGSTSQAAALVEAVEAGARVLLIDEDTSATNLLVRDERMRRLIPREGEPITPLVERIRSLRTAWGVSTVMVVGGVGDYLAEADRVIGMTDWRARDLSTEARAVAGPAAVPPGPLGTPAARIPVPDAAGRVQARDRRAVRFGDAEIDLTGVAHVLDGRHAASIGRAVALVLEELADGRRTVRQLLDALEAILDDEGVESLSPFRAPPGDLVRPRRHEVAAALNRLRSTAWERRDPR